MRLQASAQQAGRAVRLARQRGPGSGLGGSAHRRGRRRRRGRPAAGRRARADPHHRLLHPDRGRPLRLGTHRRHQRAVRCVRDGRPSADGGQPRRMARRRPARGDARRRHARWCGRRPGWRLLRGRRPHHQRSRAQVRHGGGRARASGPAPGDRPGDRGMPARPDQGHRDGRGLDGRQARHGLVGERRGRGGVDDHAQRCRLGGRAGGRGEGRDRRDRVSGCWAICTA